MSVDSTALERSALERKDRDELLTIAKALGGEPKARVKKADIVDMILDLAGVGAGAAEAAPAEAAAPKPRPTRARSPRSTAAAPAKASDDAEPPAEWEAAQGESSNPEEAAAGRDTPEPRERTSNQQDRGGRNGAQGRGGNQSGSGRQGNNGGNNGGNGQGSQGQQSQQSQQSQQGQQGQSSGAPGDDEEGGNRRRRRRGRNRGQSEGQPQSQGQGQSQGAVEEYTGEPIDVEGYLDLRDEGYGFLRISGYLPSKDDIYVSVKQARQLGLRKGDHLKGASRPALRNEKNPALLRIDLVNGDDPEKARDRRRFDDLTPLFPDSKLTLELPKGTDDMTARIIDLIAPIGKGQRGLIVSPPKAGKTTVVKQIVRSIELNHPEVHLFVLLVDERPEEVTDMQRWLKNDTSTVIASTFDRPAEEHTHVAELAIERAKRLVEDEKDVVIVLDGITRLSRAYNLAAPSTGRVMSGGIDTGALYPPKKFFGAARNVEEGGSLTILATALVETGSRMDEVIFEEFKGTGNMELRLDRRLAEQRIYPAVDVEASSTRHEELLFLGTQLQQVWKLRRVLSTMSSEAGVELLTDRMKTFKTNKEFLAEVAKAGAG